MKIRNIIVSLTFAAVCQFGLSAQSIHKQELSTNFGLPSRQPEETLPVSTVPVVMPQRVERQPAVTILKPVSDNTWEITSGWKLYEGDKIGSDDWYNAVVPGTVLTTLVQQGVYPDPKFGLNNLSIPDDLCRKDWWYCTEFTLSDEMLSGKTLELLFNGINYKADIWLNGSKIGNIAGAFIRGRFDITELARKENKLSVHIYPPANPGIPHEQSPSAGGGKNGGALCLDGPTFFCSEGWDWIPGVRDRNIGIWQDVQLIASHGAVIGDTQVITDLPLPDVSYTDITVKTTVRNLLNEEKEATVTGNIAGTVFSKKVTVPAKSEIPVNIDGIRIDNPALWMPNGYGEQNLYNMSLECKIGETLSDSRNIRFGVREMSYELTVDSADEKGIRIEYNPLAHSSLGTIFDNRMLRGALPGVHVPSLYPEVDVKNLDVIPDDGMGPYLVIKVNGVRIFCKGGNWGMDDMMKNISREHLEPYFQLHKDANFNMIRNWTGASTSEMLYTLCDEYGLLVWNDFWLSTEGFNLNPLDEDLFMENAVDVVRRFNNHPSIALWCPRNEGYATETLERRLAAMLVKEDGTRHYHPNSRYCNLRPSGPWHYYKDAAKYYREDAFGFNTELGSPSVPTAASMRKMMPEADLWPISDTWHYHDLLNGLHEYVNAVDRLYGKAENLDDFCRKVQLINYDSYRAMFESWNSRLWDNTSGVLLWMSHPAWPSVEWQTYSWDYETFGSYYGSRKACEPVHIQMNLDDKDVTVINTSMDALKSLTVNLSCYDLNGKKIISRIEKGINIPANSKKEIFKAETDNIDGTYILRLALSDNKGRSLSVNDYILRGNGTEDYQALNSIPQAKIKARRLNQTAEGKCRFEISNAGKSIALNLKMNLRDASTGEIILPAYFSDGYFHLLPGEKRIIEVSSPSQGNVSVEGYNVPQQTIIR